MRVSYGLWLWLGKYLCYCSGQPQELKVISEANYKIEWKNCYLCFHKLCTANQVVNQWRNLNLNEWRGG